MYIVQRGVVASQGMIFTRGMVFGSDMLATNISGHEAGEEGSVGSGRRKYMAIALTFADVMTLSQESLSDILAGYPDVEKRLRKAVVSEKLSKPRFHWDFGRFLL